MLFRSLVAAATLALSALAADKARWAREAAANADGIVHLDSASYDELLAEPRDYGVAMVLTALPQQFQCAPCREFDPTFKAVAKSWSKLPADKRQDVVFAQLDFPNGQTIYQRLGLQTAPTMQFWPATAGDHATKGATKATYEFQRMGFSVETFHGWVKQLTPHEFAIFKPFNPIPYIVLPAVGILSLAMLFVSYPYIWPVLQSKTLWTLLSLAMILVFTSGHMWSRIRSAPYTMGGSLIVGGFQNQVGAETDIVAALYGVLALSTVILTLVIPNIKSAPRQRAATFAWIAVTFVLFSALVKLFKIKNGGYPFRLLFG